MTTLITGLAHGWQVKVDDKSNEITAIPKLLERLSITDEDRNRTRQGYSASNLAVIRQIALNLIKKETSAKVGVKTKRLKAG
jgi:predicted transposase YbfD/YdcC